MALDDERIKELLGLTGLEKQEKLLNEFVRLYEMHRYYKGLIKESKLAYMRMALFAFENGVQQSDMADLVDTSRQHISRMIYEYRLIRGIPEDKSLEEHEEALAFLRRLKFNPPEGMT